MEKLFYAETSAFPSSQDAVYKILREYFRLENAVIEKTETGKPLLRLENGRLFFSVTHTAKRLFIAFCDENVGIDAEELTRDVHYLPIVKKFPPQESAEIDSREEFLRHWTVKESAVKWLGGTLAKDLNKLCFAQNQLSYNGLDIPVYVTTRIFDGHVLSVCSECNFENAEFISL